LKWSVEGRDATKKEIEIHEVEQVVETIADLNNIDLGKLCSDCVIYTSEKVGKVLFRRGIRLRIKGV